MELMVHSVRHEAWSTIAIGTGVDSEGREVTFGGDHRPMAHLAEALEIAGEPLPVEIEDWQVLSVEYA